MHLLNASTLSLEVFNRSIPAYVILSHTWTDGEITFDDIHRPYARHLPGYTKVVKCCQQALSDGFDYVWIDTCCIDKRSSAMLSEAINSMYNYYKRAEICYAYLADVSSSDVDGSPEAFEASRWFTRGWTLQELLAPEVVEFYAADWTLIGTKRSLVESIHRATRIHEQYLFYPHAVRAASVAQKFSWAARRETRREEDIAYCLMGLVDVNMPLLYGEGKKAFIRLQWEIVKQTNEHTFLCWENMEGRYLVRGPFCGSPEAFEDCGAVYNKRDAFQAASHTMTNRGLEIELPCIQHVADKRRVLALLNCQVEGKEVGIWLVDKDDGLYYRAGSRKLELLSHSDADSAVVRRICISGEDGNYTKEDSPLTPCRLKLTRVHSADDRFANRYVMPGRLAKSTLEFYTQNAHVYREEDRNEVNDNECMGLLLSNGVAAFLVAFGLHRRELWFQIVPDISIEELDESLGNALTLRTMHWSNYVFGRDTMTAIVQDSVSVSAFAKKRRSEGSIVWNLEVSMKSAGDASGLLSHRFDEIQSDALSHKSEGTPSEYGPLSRAESHSELFTPRTGTWSELLSQSSRTSTTSNSGR